MEDIIQILDDHIARSENVSENSEKPPSETDPLEELPALGGSGGCVALGADGTLVAPFTTAGMYRGWVTRDGVVTVRIHGDERR